MNSTPKFPHCWVEGDRLPAMTCTLVDKDLTAYTVTLHLRRIDGTVLIKAATAIDLEQGHFSFDWAEGDLVAGYNQEAEVQFVDGDDKPLTSKLFLIDVRPEIA
jgi:hypothetical protein